MSNRILTHRDDIFAEVAVMAVWFAEPKSIAWQVSMGRVLKCLLILSGLDYHIGC